MVAVAHPIVANSDFANFLVPLAEGLSEKDKDRLEAAGAYAIERYAGQVLGSGEEVWPHALGMAMIIAGLRLDADARVAALLFAVPMYDPHGIEHVEANFGRAAAQLVGGISRLNHLRPITRGFVADAQASPQELRAQVEILRKMLLAMVEDIRVVLLRLASRTQTLRHYARQKEADALRAEVARETMDIYAPLANRLGVWELKWELEDLSFRFLHPEIYKKIARMLDEKRVEREQFIADAIATLRRELDAIGIKAEIYGRPKHIFSIWNKMKKKGVEFSEVYDVRALRVIVPEVRDCYTVLGIVHDLWTPIPKEFDDYISNPKGNNYRSLHTAVNCPDGRALEVQIRTWEMHKHSELGVAAHWRYKEGGRHTPDDDYNDKIASLRQLLSWKDEVAGSSDWVKHYKEAALDETIYVLTPQGRVIDLPRGATAVDFAYRLHTELGHRCRGAKVGGQLVPLNTPLETGQRVEIITARQGGPSRDWLNPTLGYLTTKSARSKVRQWFVALSIDETMNEGRAVIQRELQRLGATQANIEDLAQKLGYPKADDLFLAAGRGELGLRQLQSTLRGEPKEIDEPPVMTPKRARAGDGKEGILIVGVDKLMTQLAKCCKPAPPDPISGFVTRGKGVSIHRSDCPSFAHVAALHPERVIETDWGGQSGSVFSVEIVVEAYDRQGLLRDISEVLAREKINVTAVNTQSKLDRATMSFTIEVENLQRLKRLMAQLHEVGGVAGVRRV